MENHEIYPLFGIQQNNWTALYVASNNGRYEVVRVLLAAKATVDTQNKVSFVVHILRPVHLHNTQSRFIEH